MKWNEIKRNCKNVGMKLKQYENNINLLRDIHVNIYENILGE